ncbi:MAG: hypothetical protein JW914_04905 [Syntrophaceae bacterium]|nr:hypothetical protein [Syntrophaceae bacterium]
MKKYSYTFDAFGFPLKIFGNWPDCLKDICSWYVMPPLETSCEPQLTIEISGANIEEIEKHMPLPSESHKLKKGVMLANENFDYTSSADNERQWIDYARVGRIMIDYANGSAIALMCGSAMLPTYQKILFPDYALDKLLASRGIFSMHASCAVVNGKGIAFTGNSGAGKSTAAFILMQKGMPILTDEKLYVFKKDGYRAGAVSDIIKVNDDSMSRFFAGRDSYSEYDVIAGEHYLKMSAATKSAGQNQSPLKALCLLEQTGVPQTQISAVNPTKLVGGLFPVTITGTTRRYKAAKFDFIMEMLVNIECRLVKFGTDIDSFTEKIKELADTL